MANKTEIETIEAGVESHAICLREHQIGLIRDALGLYIASTAGELHATFRRKDIYPATVLDKELKEARHLLDIFPKPFSSAKDETGQIYGILWSIMKTYYKETKGAEK